MFQLMSLCLYYHWGHPPLPWWTDMGCKEVLPPVSCFYLISHWLYSPCIRCLDHVIQLSNLDVMKHIINVGAVETTTTIWKWDPQQPPQQQLPQCCLHSMHYHCQGILYLWILLFNTNSMTDPLDPGLTTVTRGVPQPPNQMWNLDTSQSDPWEQHMLENQQEVV